MPRFSEHTQEKGAPMSEVTRPRGSSSASYSVPMTRCKTVRLVPRDLDKVSRRFSLKLRQPWNLRSFLSFSI